MVIISTYRLLEQGGFLFRNPARGKLLSDMRWDIAYGQVTISWAIPDNGGLPITGFEYTIGDGRWIPIPNSANLTSFTVTGLQNGVMYSFWLRARNAVGAGGSSPLRVSATPM